MHIKKFRHENVLPDGTFSNQSGSVETKGKIIMSQENGGCSLSHCSCSEGHWISICAPRTPDGVVEGIKVIFDNKAEMQLFLKQRELSGWSCNLFN